MDNTNNSQNDNSNNLQSETIYPHAIFSFERKDYTIDELLIVFSVNYFDLNYLHNVIPSQPPYPSQQSELLYLL